MAKLIEIPVWIEYLRTNTDAWNDYLAWLKVERQHILETNATTWDEENKRQGRKLELDIILHLSTIDQKDELALNAYLGGK